MPRIYLVRHGEPASSWGEADPDPGLSALGLAQAAHAAGVLAGLKVKQAMTSPLRRCMETAAAFEMEVGLSAVVVRDVAEVPTPAGIVDRPAWLRGVMAGAWDDQPSLAPFREGVIKRLLAQRSDVAVFSHYVAINAAVGAALGRAEVMVCKPAHASITILSNDGGELSLIEAGAEAPAVNAL
jgi:broad specificity phosphatase PhoE